MNIQSISAPAPVVSACPKTARQHITHLLEALDKLIEQAQMARLPNAQHLSNAQYAATVAKRFLKQEDCKQKPTLQK